jgi:hypothetical protein
MQEFRVAAKALGTLALEDHCKRCFWIDIHTYNTPKYGLPYQDSFPGVFNALDRYEKDVTWSYHKENGVIPAWLPVSGTPVETPKSGKKFQRKHEETGITLCGIPDEIIKTAEGFAILDYKTSQSKDNDPRFPVYETQLNGYKFIAENPEDENWRFDPVTQLFLVYAAPQSAVPIVRGKPKKVVNRQGFTSQFDVSSKPVDLRQDKLFDLLYEARRIYDLEAPPATLMKEKKPKKGEEKGEIDYACKNCKNVDGFMRMMQGLCVQYGPDYNIVQSE